MTIVTKNCAIYTRKSTDEGLDTDFNTLDAQRESCEAFIVSQKAEGWRVVPTQYNDGGFSGGNMNRPALQKLLADIKQGKIQTVVVYKIDRLTRSLMDFSKLVEIFDAHGVTFVSVTQSFNTTTSMGRLTLNVLLSFAQFEREVSAERIRDKFAASKKKGMWMGGNVPLGYDVVKRKLIVNDKDSKTLKMIFEQYLKLGCVTKLKTWLDDNNIKSTRRISLQGKELGGKSYSRGALHSILRNPIYIGKILHKENLYDGLHDGIIENDLWGAVQERLQSQAAKKRGYQNISHKSPLRTILYDVSGQTYSMTYTRKDKKQHRYYISKYLSENKTHPQQFLTRLPANEIETVVINAVHQNIAKALGLNDIEHYAMIKAIEQQNFENHIQKFIKRIEVDESEMRVQIEPMKLKACIEDSMNFTVPQIKDPAPYCFTIPYYMRRSIKGAVIIKSEEDNDAPFDLPAAELKNLICGVVWRDRHFAGESIRQIARDENLSEAGVRRIIMRSFDILSSI